MSLIITFMFEPAKLQMNWARARGTSTLRSALDGRPLVLASVIKHRLASSAGPDHPTGGLLVQLPVQGDRGVDEGQVREGLGEVADLLDR